MPFGLALPNQRPPRRGPGYTTTRTPLPRGPYEEITDYDNLDPYGQPKAGGLARSVRTIDPELTRLQALRSMNVGTSGGMMGTSVPRAAAAEDPASADARALSLFRAKLQLEDESYAKRVKPDLEPYVDQNETTLLSSLMNTLNPKVRPGGRASSRAAQASEFAQARNKIGRGTRGALTALREEMSARGIAGSGIEAQGASSIINQGQSDLADTSTTQALDALRRDYDVEDRDYAGQLAQRQAGLGLFPALLNAAQRRRRIVY